MPDWNWYQSITFGIAVFGAFTGGFGLALGIYNTWYAKRKDTPRFRLEAAIVRNSGSTDMSERELGRMVKVRIVNSGMIDLYIDKIWLTRSLIRRIFRRSKPRRWELSPNNRMVRSIFDAPIAPKNDISFTIMAASLEGALSRGMHTFVAYAKTGESAKFTLDDLANLKVVDVAASPTAVVSKRIRVKD